MPLSGPLGNIWENITKSKADCIIRIKGGVAKCHIMGYLSMGNLSWGQNASNLLTTYFMQAKDFTYFIWFYPNNKSLRKNYDYYLNYID